MHAVPNRKADHLLASLPETEWQRWLPLGSSVGVGVRSEKAVWLGHTCVGEQTPTTAAPTTGTTALHLPGARMGPDPSRHGLAPSADVRAAEYPMVAALARVGQDPIEALRHE